MGEDLGIGFIGCGSNARAHLKRLADIPNVRIVGVCDVAEELAAGLAAETGAAAYTDHRRLLDRADLQAVYISLPVFAHGEPEFGVIERGLPFLVEKPVAIDMPPAREIERRVREKGLITSVGYQLRYGATVDAAREVLAGRRIGLVNGRYWSNTGAGDPTRWLRCMAQSGGQLVEQATHTVDMMRFLAGEITEVYCAAASQVLKEIDCPDFSAVALRFANGAVGALTASWAFAQGWGNANIVDILFEDKMLTWSYGKLIVLRDGKPEEFRAAGPTVDEVFVNAVRTGDSSAIRSPYSDAVTSLAASLAMNRSARENRPVSVAEMG